MLEGKKDHAEGRKVTGQRTILYDILNNDQISLYDKQTERLVQELISVVAAGYYSFLLVISTSPLQS